MAKKKIKFALKLKEGVEVRNLQELREGFDLNQIVAYFLEGKLETWLMDRYYEDLAEKISNLDKSDPELRKKLCEIFEVEYEEDSLSVEEIEERNRRIKKLKEITDDEEIIKNVDKVAFCQEELADLLDEGQKTIYLCGTDFHIPVSKKGIRYTGIETKLDITEEEREKYEANDIELIDLLEDYFDDRYAIGNQALSAVNEPSAPYTTSPVEEDFGVFMPNTPESRELTGITISYNGEKMFLSRNKYFPYSMDIIGILCQRELASGKIPLSIPKGFRMQETLKLNGNKVKSSAYIHDKNIVEYTVELVKL